MPLWHGFMAFMADTPLMGLRPHPAWAPQAIRTRPTTAAGWAEVYNCSPSHADLLIEAHESAAEMQAMRAEDREDDADEDDEDLEDDDVDDVFAVAVDDSGALHIFDTEQPEPSCIYTAAQVFAAYGMDLPPLAP